MSSGEVGRHRPPGRPALRPPGGVAGGWSTPSQGVRSAIAVHAVRLDRVRKDLNESIDGGFWKAGVAMRHSWEAMATTLESPQPSGLAEEPARLADDAVLLDREQVSRVGGSTGVAGSAGADSAATRIEELGRIILAYSEVTERLERSHEQLRREVKRLQEELGEKNRQLERRNRLAALGEMAAGLAHEIRNPLGAMQLYLSALSAEFAEASSGAKTVSKMRGAVLRLEGIVSQVLQFAREMRVQPGEGRLSGLVAECVEMVSARALAGRVQVQVLRRGSEADGATAWFDRLLMSQALLNIMLNAVEATPAGGRVEVSYGVEGREAFVRVADTGPGVPAEVVDRIFNPFFTTKAEGTGLGLSIVHRIAEAHDGAVTVRNRRGTDGKTEAGAVFELRWPSRPRAGLGRDAA